MVSRAPSGADGLTEAERDLLLDLGQMVLDLAGIVDPTPISDGTNAVISAGRGDWWGAGISAVSMVPLIGDLAKAGKLGRWAETIEKSLRAMRANARFAERARPVVARLARLVNLLPINSMPEAPRPLLERIRHLLNASEFAVQSSRRQVLRGFREDWLRYIDGLRFPQLTSGQGVLWSRLDLNDGAKLSRQLATRDGKVTLEMLLDRFGFEKRYSQAVAHLRREAAGAENAKHVGEEIWEEFGRPVWEAVSKKYTQSLNGRVTAYVRFKGDIDLPRGARPLEAEAGRRVVGLGEAASEDAVIWDELEAIADSMIANAKITSVQLTDIHTGTSKIMTREAVLAASRSRH